MPPLETVSAQGTFISETANGAAISLLSDGKQWDHVYNPLSLMKTRIPRYGISSALCQRW